MGDIYAYQIFPLFGFFLSAIFTLVLLFFTKTDSPYAPLRRAGWFASALFAIVSFAVLSGYRELDRTIRVDSWFTDLLFGQGKDAVELVIAVVLLIGSWYLMRRLVVLACARWPSAGPRLDAIAVWVPVSALVVIVLFALLADASSTGILLFVAFLLLLGALFYVRKRALDAKKSQ